MSFDRARAVADAVLYEGYVLYPYRASARKNQVRWQFGVLAPQGWSEAGGCEAWWLQSECPLAGSDDARLRATVRFMQLERRTVEEAMDDDGRVFRPVERLDVDDTVWTTWDEGIEQEIVVAPIALGELAERPVELRAVLPGSQRIERLRDGTGRLVGRVVRERFPLDVVVRCTVASEGGAFRKLRLWIGNETPCAAAVGSRDDALRSALVGTHALLGVEGGAFASLTDPPAEAAAVATSCANVRTWPVLVGAADARDVMLSSPIILGDHPEIAPESPGDLCDATEIDEILTLRTMTLTDDEKAEARATDPRARAIVDRADATTAETLERLHGTLRPVPDSTNAAPWWDPAADASVSPETDALAIGGVPVSRGSRVRLRPGARRTDAQDMFLAGRVARVQAVLFDVEERGYLAVTLEDDPASDLHVMHGRYLYFDPAEVEPMDAAS